MNGNINIFNELRKINASFLLNADNKNYFFLPEDYFENFPGNVATQIFIKTLPVHNPFSVPENYFNELAEVFLENIKVKSFERSNISRVSVYSTPEGYFETLAGNILNKIKNSSYNPVQQELEEISPLLSKISKANVYSVPTNYFEDLEFTSAKKNIEPQAKVISFGSKTRKWLNYAAAACVAVVLFGGGYSYFNKNQTTSPDKKQPISLAAVDVQKEISALTDDEINSYLESNNNNGVYTNSYDTDENQSMDVQFLLQNISDEEIQHYLDQAPDSKKRGGI